MRKGKIKYIKENRIYKISQLSSEKTCNNTISNLYREYN